MIQQEVPLHFGISYCFRLLVFTTFSCNTSSSHRHVCLRSQQERSKTVKIALHRWTRLCCSSQDLRGYREAQSLLTDSLPHPCLQQV